jgi:hypothetical protein
MTMRIGGSLKLAFNITTPFHSRQIKCGWLLAMNFVSQAAATDKVEGSAARPLTGLATSAEWLIAPVAEKALNLFSASSTHHQGDHVVACVPRLPFADLESGYRAECDFGSDVSFVHARPRTVRTCLR